MFFLLLILQGKISLDEARRKTWLFDTEGLVTKSRHGSLYDYKKPFAHDHEHIKDLVSAIKVSVLLLSSSSS
jgi:malate dehydrogenase (oxaloacetate-decarboxylating)(NADP+)